jgi:hypothetical protein
VPDAFFSAGDGKEHNPCYSNLTEFPRSSQVIVD